MDIEDFQRLNNTKSKVFIDASYLKDISDRTLLRGTTGSGASWHVYIKDGKIHTVFQRRDEVAVTQNSNYVPFGGKLYPEFCDFDFCCLLKKVGVPLVFDTFGSAIGYFPPDTKFYGVVL